MVAGDYSNIRGYVAYTPYGELSDPMVVSLTPQDLHAIADNDFSSTFGVLLVLLKLMQMLTQSHPHLIVGKTLCYESDNSALVWDIQRMNGDWRNYPVVRRIWELAMNYNLTLEPVWYSRDTPNQVEAARLSKLTDNSEWVLNTRVFQDRVVSAAAMFGYTITLDVFASTTNGKAPRFYSK